MPLHEEELEASDASFVAVRVADFYSARKIAFAVHLRLGPGRYLRIFRAGEDFNEAELKSYEVDRGIRYVYFEAVYRPIYIKASAALMQRISSLAGVPLKKKFGMARVLSELYLQELFLSDDDSRPDLIEKGKQICSLLAAWIDSEPNLESFLVRLEVIDPSVESLSFLTGIFSSLISRRFPWKSQRTTETLLLASFLSDLGLVALPPEVVKLRPRRMSEPQRRQFEKHPEISYLLLQEMGALHENVLLIVRQHHEYCDGSGFPHKLTSDKTLLLAKLVCLSGDLVRNASDYLLPPNDAAKMMFPVLSKKCFTSYPELVAKYDHDLLDAFFAIFGRDTREEEAA